MKTSTLFKSGFLLPALFCCTLPVAFAQKYQTLADTARLNAERNKLTRDIAKLNTELTDLKAKSPEYETTKKPQVEVAQDTAQKSKDMAIKATNDDLGKVRKANAVGDVPKKVKVTGKKVDKLNQEIDKKQQRLNELNQLSTTITSAGTTAGPR